MDVYNEENCSSNRVTLASFLLSQRAPLDQGAGSFNMLFQSIQLACKVIASATNKGGIANKFGAEGNLLSRNEQNKRLNVVANETFRDAMKASEQVYMMVSQGEVEPIIAKDSPGQYAVVFDPLDGASNIDANVSVGTIFGIYKHDAKEAESPSVSNLLKPGEEQMAAGYCLYGAATVMVLTTGVGVDAFTLDASLGEFILTRRNIKIPQQGQVYSVNEANSGSWDTASSEYINAIKKSGATSRYIGSMVADVHRTLLYGGVFCYPGDNKNASGKLRLMYECAPLAMIIEQAGGVAVDGKQRILDIKPSHVHATSPIYLGSPSQIQPILDLYKKHRSKL